MAGSNELENSQKREDRGGVDSRLSGEITIKIVLQETSGRSKVSKADERHPVR